MKDKKPHPDLQTVNLFLVLTGLTILVVLAFHWFLFAPAALTDPAIMSVR